MADKSQFDIDFNKMLAVLEDIADDKHEGRAGPAVCGGAARAMRALRHAVEALYFAGYWHCDRPVDEQALWTALRDAAGIQPGQTAERLGPDRSSRWGEQ